MVSSVLKALDILELFTLKKPVLMPNEIADALGYPRSTIRSILATLASRGYVEKTAETSQRLLARSAVGDEVPLHCTAVGKAMLAFLSAEERDSILEEVGLPSFTENTITHRELLEEELRLTGERGYAIDNEEHERHLYCIGAPVFDAAGEIAGSCSISGHEEALIGAELEYYSSKVKATAQEISRRMGFVPDHFERVWEDVWQ